MKEIILKSEIENVGALTKFVDDYLDENDCPMKAKVQINVAIDEIFSNICFYAYKELGDVRVTIDVFDSPKKAELTFYDNGIQYDPLKKEDPDITLSAEERQIGGLGIFMVKKTMDEIIYRYENSQNVLKISKCFG